VVNGNVEAGRRYTEKDFNRIIEIQAREAHRVKLFMEQIDHAGFQKYLYQPAPSL
jgi:type I restriction enzyme, R subunit